MAVKKKFFNPELNKEDIYTEVWKNEYVTVKDEKLVVKNHYWQDSKGELWGDFDDPMENVHRSFAAYRKKKKFLSPESIRKIRESLGYTVREFAEKLGISPSAVTQIENNHRIQTKYQDMLFKSALYDPELLNKDFYKSDNMARSFSIKKKMSNSRNIIKDDNYSFTESYVLIEV